MTEEEFQDQDSVSVISEKQENELKNSIDLRIDELEREIAQDREEIGLQIGEQH